MRGSFLEESSSAPKKKNQEFQFKISQNNIEPGVSSTFKTRKQEKEMKESENKYEKDFTRLMA